MSVSLEILPLMIVALLVGDFLFQNHDMAANKATRHAWCARHIAAYSVPFLLLCAAEILPLAIVPLIAGQHYLQDRYALHLRWMQFYRQTPPSKWPAGPLCVDQSMHLAWIALVVLFSQ